MNAHVLPQPLSMPYCCFTRHSLPFFRSTKAMPPKETDASPGADIEQQLMVLLSQITTARRATESEVAQINLLPTMTAAQQDASHQALPETVESPQPVEGDADSPHTHHYHSPLTFRPLQLPTNHFSKAPFICNRHTSSANHTTSQTTSHSPRTTHHQTQTLPQYRSNRTF